MHKSTPHHRKHQETRDTHFTPWYTGFIITDTHMSIQMTVCTQTDTHGPTHTQTHTTAPARTLTPRDTSNHPTHPIPNSTPHPTDISPPSYSHPTPHTPRTHHPTTTPHISIRPTPHTPSRRHNPCLCECLNCLRGGNAGVHSKAVKHRLQLCQLQERREKRGVEKWRE